MPETTSLRALIQDRKTKQTRPTYRHLFSLAPDLYTERLALEQALDDLPAPSEPREGAQGRRLNPATDQRRAALEADLAALDDQIAAATVAVVFKALTADKMGAKVAEWEKAKTATLAQARDLMLECFDRFDTDEPLTRDDFADLIPTLTQGETFGVSNALSDLAVGEVDIPKSVRLSMTTRRSAATSKRA